MSGLDPNLVFEMIASQVPPELHENVLIIGSLAAAYHYRARLGGVAINTKDADVVVQPAGALPECAAIAGRLLELGWRRRPGCVSQPSPDDVAQLSVIRLHPPASDAFFLELPAFPSSEQTGSKAMHPLRLGDGWYVLPTFRHLRLVARGQQRSSQGLRYAAPEMMALSNLLAHRRLGPERVSQAIAGRHVLRSAKDLGRVLALTRLAEIDEMEGWVERWAASLAALYSHHDALDLAAHAGDGIRALLADPGALDDAHFTVDDGLLRGLDVSRDQLRAVAEQLLAVVLDPLAERTTMAAP